MVPGADLCLVQVQRPLPALDAGQLGVGCLKIGDEQFQNVPIFAECGLPRIRERDFDELANRSRTFYNVKRRRGRPIAHQNRCPGRFGIEARKYPSSKSFLFRRNVKSGECNE
jgi:hypothetical protein